VVVYLKTLDFEVKLTELVILSTLLYFAEKLCPIRGIYCCMQALVFTDQTFQHILRIQNTNVDGKQKVMYALTAIKGIGRR
jgi:hypothetical protein